MPATAEEEALVLVPYLVGRAATPEAIMLYARARTELLLPLTAEEQRLWSRCLKHRILLPLVDAALAFRKESGIRRRLFVLLAILESLPAYADCFLPKRRSAFYLLYLLWKGGLSLLKAALGFPLLWIR